MVGPVRHRQVDAGAAARRTVARAVARGGTRVSGDPERGWPRSMHERWGQRVLRAPASHRVGGGARRREPHRRDRAKLPSRTTVSYSSMSCQNFNAPRSRPCASRWKPAASPSHVRHARPSFRRASSSLSPAMNPLPLRPARQSGACLLPHARHGPALSGACDQRAAARPHRSAGGSACRRNRPHRGRSRWRSERRRPRTK